MRRSFVPYCHRTSSRLVSPLGRAPLNILHPPAVQHVSLRARRAGLGASNTAMPFLSPLGGEDADDFYFGYDAGYHRSGGAGKSAKKEEKKKEKGFLSCLPCFIPCCK